MFSRAVENLRSRGKALIVASVLALSTWAVGAAPMTNPDPGLFENDIDGQGYFRSSGASLAWEIFDLGDTQASFGFYPRSGPNPAVTIFEAADLALEYAIVSFADGYVYDVEDAAVQSTFAVPVGDFGFFLDLPGLGTFYSDPTYNPGGSDVFGAFPVIGQPGDYSFTFSAGGTVLAWELMTNLQAVPEPGVIVLLGAGLVGLVGLSRRRRTGGDCERRVG